MSRLPPYAIVPIAASAGFCIVIALVTFLMLPQGKTHFEFLWWGALMFGVPTSLIGTFVLAPAATYFRDRPIRFAAICGVAGAALGYFGFAILWNLLLSIGSGGGRPPPSDLPASLLYLAATMLASTMGLILFLVALVTYAFHRIAQLRKASHDEHT